MGIPSDYKKYMSNYVPPSPLKKRAGRKKKKREKKRNGVIQQLQVNNKGIISDDLPEVIQNCSRVLVIKNGKIKSEYDTQNVSEQMIIDDMM